MKNLLFLCALLFITTLTFSQDAEADPDAPKEGWTKGGTFTLLLNQSAFDNWLAGGQNNIAGNLGINYDLNYAKGDWTWDNKLIVAYGLTKIEDADLQKTDDRLEINSVVGKKASGNWFYSAFFNFRTQMDSAFDVDEDGNEFQTTHFFSPAYFQFGPGMLWKKSDNLKVNIAPATARLIFVHEDFTNFTGDAAIAFNEAGGYFGVEAGETTRFELGAAVGAYYKFNAMANVSVENILNLYSNYLEDPQNVDLDYTLNVVMTINKFLSTNLSFQTIYDDNAFKGFQIREVFGLGVNFGF